MIDTTRGYTCYDESTKQANVMVSRGAEDFELAGMQIGLASEGEIKSYTLKEGANLLTNADFQLWSAGPSSAPDGWTLNQVVAREGTIKKIGSYSAKLTWVDASARLTQDIKAAKGIAYWQGRTVTISSWVYATVASRARLSINDGVGNTYSSWHTGGGSWEFLTATRTLDASATVVEARLYIQDGATISYFDGAMLVEGPDAVIWEEDTIYGELPNQNEAKTYQLSAGDLSDIKEATVAPVVRVGTTEKVCDVSSKVQIPRCA